MQDRLRRKYQVQKEVTQNSFFEGEIAQAKLGRLNEFLFSAKDLTDSDTVRVKFEFIASEYKLALIQGTIEAPLTMECQRCLAAVEMAVTLEFKLLVNADDETVENSGLDTLVSDDGYIDIVELVEDELILGFPLVTLHEDGACNKHWPSSKTDFEPAVKDNPFLILKQLKTKV